MSLYAPLSSETMKELKLEAARETVQARIEARTGKKKWR
jgi:hypothetical protein